MSVTLELLQGIGAAFGFVAYWWLVWIRWPGKGRS